MATEFGSRDFPRAYGVACTGTVLTTIGAPFVAYLAEVTGNYMTSLLLIAAGCGMALVGALLYRDRPAQAQPLSMLRR